MASLSFEAPIRFVRARKAPAPKHLLSANAIDIDEVDDLCHLAEAYEHGGAPIAGSSGQTVALLFFQPSTRTRAGFQVATVGLGSYVVGFEDMSMSRSNQRTGESLEDCAAVFSRLCNAIVVRHHEVGAAARMAAKAVCPVVNAGDGWNEHPTQALVDIFALRRGLGTIRGASIAFGGDPRGRTVRSLIRLLRYESPSEIVFCPPPHVPVPEDILVAVADNQIRCRIVSDIQHPLKECDALMMAPYDMSDIGEAAASGYVSPRSTPQSHVVTPEKIERCNSRTLLFHPLPRQDEIDPACDDLYQAMYFEQVRLSKYMRMAILSRVLSRH